MEKQLKEIIRSVVREQFISEMSQNDVHVKEIMKFYDKGSSNAKKALSLYLLRKPHATRNQIMDELGDYGYNDVWEVMDHFKLKLEYVDKKGVEHVAASLPQTEEEPINGCKSCNSK
jgi:RNA:NAD 2'-phosphotransferase (TPT1/KptA family)